MMGMEGSKVAMNRVEGTINILGKYYTHVFSIFDGSKTFGAIQEKTGIQIHGILGLDFMVKYRWILDFERYVVIEKEEKKVK